MTEQTPSARLPYEDFSDPDAMARDCRAALGHNRRLEQAARAAVSTPPSLRFDDYPTEVRKRDIEVSEAAARLAAALHLHLD